MGGSDLDLLQHLVESARNSTDSLGATEESNQTDQAGAHADTVDAEDAFWDQVLREYLLETASWLGRLQDGFSLPRCRA